MHLKSQAAQRRFNSKIVLAFSYTFIIDNRVLISLEDADKSCDGERNDNKQAYHRHKGANTGEVASSPLVIKCGLMLTKS